MTGDIHLFRSTFVRAGDAYGIEASGSPKAIRSPLTDDLLRDHLDGRKRIGAYTTDTEGLADQLIIDIDIPKEKATDPKEWERARSEVRRVMVVYDDLGIEAFITSSKSRGYHVRTLWEPTRAAELRRLGVYVIGRAGIDAEIFPKQDKRGADGLGNFVWLPLHGGSLKNGKTAILDSGNGLDPMPDQWEALKDIRRNSVETLAATLTVLEEQEREKGTTRAKAVPPIGERIPDGKRSNTLISLAGSMRKRNFSQEAIESALLAENTAKCVPPFTDAEVLDIARRYEGQSPPAAIEKFRATDLYAGRLFAHHIRGKFVFCPPMGGWIYFTGIRWSLDECGEIQRQAKLMSQKVAEQAFIETDTDLRAKMYKFCATLESSARLTAMIELASTEEGIVVRPDVFDRDINLLNTPTSTINLRTGEIRPHDPKDFITKMAGCSMDAAMPTPIFNAFLARIMKDNANIIRFIQKFLGLCLTGDISEHVFPIFHGKGSNGKTTLLELMIHILGDYAETINFTSLAIRKNNDAAYNDLAALKGARLVVVDEGAEGVRLNEELVKKITGSKTIRARFLFREFFTYVRAFKIVLVSNHKPGIRGTDHAIWRRVRLVPFDVTIPKGEQDGQLGEKLAIEAPGILSWLLDGCLAWRREGLADPDEVTNATKRYRDEEDLVGQFITDMCVVDASLSIVRSSLYAAFVDWSKGMGEKYPIPQRTFNEAMEEREFERGQHGTGKRAKTWKGLDLKQPLWEKKI
jgi:putative DNA primase/helicase